MMTDMTEVATVDEPLNSIFTMEASGFGDNTAYIDMFREINEQLALESQGVPMNTIQTMLRERIAYNYVLMKYKENTNGYVRANEQKEMQAFWLSLTDQFHKILQAGQDTIRAKLLEDIGKMLEDMLHMISDPTERQAIQIFLMQRLQVMGL